MAAKWVAHGKMLGVKFKFDFTDDMEKVCTCCGGLYPEDCDCDPDDVGIEPLYMDVERKFLKIMKALEPFGITIDDFDIDEVYEI